MCDAGNGRVVKFGPDGKFLANYSGSDGTGDGFLKPVDLSIAANGEVYVLEQIAGEVRVLDAAGQFLRRWGGVNGISDGSLLDGPTGIALLGDGRVALADTGNHRVVLFDDQGQALVSFGTLGSGSGQLLFPVALVADPGKALFVAQRGGIRRPFKPGRCKCRILRHLL